MRVSRLSMFGNVLVLALLAFGGWLLWRNVTRSADPPNTATAILSETAERAGVDGTRGAPRRTGGPAGPLMISRSGLAIPVSGISAQQLTDTFTQSRAGGARVHNAIDIMAPRGTPVLAASDGIVEKLYFSKGGGGLTAYVRAPDGAWMHYYAHLDAYAPNLREGLRLKRGDPIGTVGSTGNANPDGPHLHYAIYRMRPGERWWQGVPINPYPLLAGSTSTKGQLAGAPGKG